LKAGAPAAADVGYSERWTSGKAGHDKEKRSNRETVFTADTSKRIVPRRAVRLGTLIRIKVDLSDKPVLQV